MSRIVIGTRGSQLALWQARHVRDELHRTVPDVEVEIREIKTTGDKLQEAKTSDPLPKGLFTREIESALLAAEIDVAVHSLKDLPTELPKGLRLAAVPPREDVSEALISRNGASLESLEPDSVVGSGSLRRQAFLLAMRPDLIVKPIRGNVPTRLRKLEEGYDAVILARAGLIRLGLEENISEILSPDTFPPAPGQAAIGLETRENDGATGELLATINDHDALAAVTAERSFLDGLGGGCRLPIGAWGRMINGVLVLDGTVADPEGKTVLKDRTEGGPDQSERLGRELALELLKRGADRLLEQIET
jgi:hydroxymethylbilane synthase